MIVSNMLRARARVVFRKQRLRRRTPSPKGKSLPYQHGNACYAHALRFLTSTSGRGGDGDDEDWLPPDHSPLVTAKNTKKAPSPHKNIDNDSPHQSRDEIEVIDLEATIKNPLNQRLLQEDALEPTETFSSDFEVNDVSSWKEILKELKEEGETEMMDNLVKEYNLQNYLDTLDEDGEDEDINLEKEIKPENVDGGEEWDGEFEETLRGLSEDELIDELIENSPSLSQLEVEIIGQEMERSEQGAQDGLDYDALEDLDLNENAAYRDFRAMVLEDYNEKKRLRRKIGMQEGSEKPNQEDSMVGEPSATITNHCTASDFSAYPLDWRDYDSKAAFQRDFSDDDSWIPPSTGMVPSHSLNLDQLERKYKQSPLKDAGPSRDDLDGTIDWLQARRSRLGDGSEDNKQIPTHMLSRDQGEKFSHQNSQITVVKHTLFTPTELSTSLAAQGGTDILFIDTAEFNSMYGVGIGCKFIMLVTGRGASHIRVLADSVVRNLKARKLHERGVLGAMQGAEGGQDIFSNKRSRNRARRNGATNASRKMDDDWMVVDCDNIHVHIMEATTRKCLNIEGLWDLSDPNSEGSKLRRVNVNDDEDVDTYVSENPIPDEYSAKIFNDGGGGGWITGGTGSRVLTVPAFQSKDTRKSFSERWRKRKK